MEHYLNGNGDECLLVAAKWIKLAGREAEILYLAMNRKGNFDGDKENHILTAERLRLINIMYNVYTYISFFFIVAIYA